MVSRWRLQKSVEAHQGEDIRGFKSNVVDGFSALLSLCITRDNVCRNALELFESKADTSLVSKHSSVD